MQLVEYDNCILAAETHLSQNGIEKTFFILADVHILIYTEGIKKRRVNFCGDLN